MEELRRTLGALFCTQKVVLGIYFHLKIWYNKRVYLSKKLKRQTFIINIKYNLRHLSSNINLLIV